MSANIEKSVAGFKLIQYAFRLAGLNTMDIQQCKKLSNRVLEKTGQNVSGITIFRMAHPDKYQIRSYPKTLQTLLDFCNLNSFDDIPEIVKPTQPKVLFSYGENDRADALDTLISCLLETENKKTIFNFLDRLPEKCNPVSEQQIMLSHCFANFFRSQHLVPRAAGMFAELNTHPRFQTNFTMIFPDIDFVDGYFFDGLEVYIKNVNIEKTLASLFKKEVANDDNASEQSVYHSTLYIWMAFVKNYFTGVKQLGEILYDRQDKNALRLIDHLYLPILLTRYHTAGMLYYHTLGSEQKIKKSIAQLKNFLNDIMHTNASDNEKVCCIAMGCDALLLTGQSLDCMQDLLQINELKEAAQYELEPAQTRFLMYGRNYVKPMNPESEFKNTYAHGYYELNFSSKLQAMFAERYPEALHNGFA